MNEPAKPSGFRLFSIARRFAGFGGPARRPGEFSGTLIIVVPLTLLIWIYAERAERRDYVLNAQFNVVAADPNFDARVLDEGDSRVAVTVYGPRGQIDQIDKQLQQDGRIDVQLTPGQSVEGDINVDLAARLNETPIFANSGLTIKSTTPSQLKVKVDRVVTLMVAVKLPPDLPVKVNSQDFDPVRVEVRGPASLINSEFGGSDPTINVDTRNVRWADAATPAGLSVPLAVPRGGRITVSPATVRMKIDLGSDVKEGEVRSAPIVVERPAGEEGTTKVVLKKQSVVYSVKIKGPSNLVDQYIGPNPTVPLVAVLRVERRDALRGEVIERKVLFPYLEPEVKVIGDYPVPFEIVEITSEPR